MGEKIRTLSRGKIHGVDFEVELNKAHAAHMPRDIHIQSNEFRYNLDEREYLHLALTVLNAKKKLEKLKGIGE